MKWANRIGRLERQAAARETVDCPPWVARDDWQSRQRLGPAARAILLGGDLPAGLTPEEHDLAAGYAGVIRLAAAALEARC